MRDDPLPIDEVMPAIRDTVARSNRLVLAAPPGAGKTTRVPLELLGHPACAEGRIILIEPRRIAARAAAARMAETLGERLGETVGLATRLERKVSAGTRIEVVTDGLFTRRILASPDLEKVSTVIFDEFHERSLNADLGLALALDAQAALREDLRLVLMSATLDTDVIAGALGAPVIASEGRMFPVETHYLGRGKGRVEDEMAAAILKALAREKGSVLAFLPGAAEIRRTSERLAGSLPSDVEIAPLYGALPPKAQDAAIRPAAPGRRKLVLATDIAESALTIEGVRVVVDAGLARVPQADPSGLRTRLVTVRASQASVEQRRGRAGRTGPGACYRLWQAPETRGLPPRIEPEILSGDLTGLVLSLADWGESDPLNLNWIDPPPAGRIKAARRRLRALGALDAGDAITARGREMAALPLSPQLAALVVAGDTAQARALGAHIAAILTERGMGGASVDLNDRLSAFLRDTGPRAKALKRQARRWGGDAPPRGDPGEHLVGAWPDALARRRSGERPDYLLASGEAGRLDENDRLAREPWLAIAEMVGAGGGARITLAAPIGETAALSIRAPVSEEIAEYDRSSGRLRAARIRHVGAIELSRQPLPAPSGAAARAAITEVVKADGFEVIGVDAVVREVLARISLLRACPGEDWPDWNEETLQETCESWMPEPDGNAPPGEQAVRDALVAHLGWPQASEIARLAPLRMELPSGRNARVDYLDEKAPLVEARVQELYGLSAQPAIANGAVPVTLSLLSPARRPVAITRDIAGFWTGAYGDMAKDMRARYPKHDWPDDPASAAPHEGRTRRRG